MDKSLAVASLVETECQKSRVLSDGSRISHGFSDQCAGWVVVKSKGVIGKTIAGPFGSEAEAVAAAKSAA